ncbi:unnamed protein product, partial [Symbiodinium sp. CCMP2456]
AAWGNIESRVQQVEGVVKNQGKELKAVHLKQKQSDQKVAGVQAKGDATARKTDELEGELTKLKTRVDEIAANAESSVNKNGPDPWQDYINHTKGGQKDRHRPKEGSGQARQNPGEDRRHELSDEDKNSLIFGGWLPDTRRATIQNEAENILKDENFVNLVDSPSLVVFGPRRSFGLLRFKQRDQETSVALRARMWEVVTKIRQNKIILDSTRGEVGDGKAVWASFMKTPEARKRSAMCSLVRRVVMKLAALGKKEDGETFNAEAITPEGYDVDWGTGTIWHGPLKLASATHRKDSDRPDDFFQLNQGTASSLRISSWNLGGQTVDKLALVEPTTDIFLTQEVARGDVGWTERESDTHFWVTHRCKDQWRGTAIGISYEVFDSVISKKATSRGIVVLVKLKGRGSVLLGTMHGHTGVTNKVYQEAAAQFLASLRGKWRMHPCILGIDVNESIRWGGQDQEGSSDVLAGSTNLNYLCDQLAGAGLRPIAPRTQDRNKATHFPRDERREGRQIDAIWGRQLPVGEVHIDALARHKIGTDHAILHVHAFLEYTRGRWCTPSKARFVVRELPDTQLVDVDDIVNLAKQCTRCARGVKYEDPPEVKEAIQEARRIGDKQAWRQVHRLRKQARRRWEELRVSCILQGDWAAYRARKTQKTKKSGWWGRMLESRTTKQLTDATTTHLASKMCGPPPDEWDADLQSMIAAIPLEDHWEPFDVGQIRDELSKMKPQASVGPDQIGVDLLRKLVDHDALKGDFVDIINHVVFHNFAPESWRHSLLALLAKVDVPTGPHELRPIAMSSALQKLTSRLVMSRTFPALRKGTEFACCGKGRQAADLVGCFTRLRDMCKEWRIPLLVAKLDIRGAFDALDRKAVARFLSDKLTHVGLGREARYLLGQLQSNFLGGPVPGGDQINIHCTTGIRQGAPESAELFALVLEAALDEMRAGQQWQRLSKPIHDLEVDLLMYQDDLFLWDPSPEGIAMRLDLIDQALAGLGLQLASKKTAVISTTDYVGGRVVKFRDEAIPVQPPHEPIRVLGLEFTFDGDRSRQARELISRLRAAFGQHRALLAGRASWNNKVFALRMLVEGAVTWVAGAVYWAVDDLQMLNTMQMHVLREIFHLGRRGFTTARMIAGAHEYVTYNLASLDIGVVNGKMMVGESMEVPGLLLDSCSGDASDGGENNNTSLSVRGVLGTRERFTRPTSKENWLKPWGQTGWTKHVIEMGGKCSGRGDDSRLARVILFAPPFCHGVAVSLLLGGHDSSRPLPGCGIGGWGATPVFDVYLQLRLRHDFYVYVCFHYFNLASFFDIYDHDSLPFTYNLLLIYIHDYNDYNDMPLTYISVRDLFDLFDLFHWGASFRCDEFHHLHNHSDFG